MNTTTHCHPGLRTVLHPKWTGNGFADAEASLLWSLLPAALQTIALAELQAGNLPEAIQLDLKTQVPLMTFAERPRVAFDSGAGVVIHRKHTYGNYCYDGTFCTYELIEPRSFLAFTDPTYDHDAETGFGA